MMSKLVLVGAGNMGFAMLSKWATGPKYELVAIEPNVDLRARAMALGVSTYASPEEIPGIEIDILVIATKPQMVGDVVARYSPLLSNDAMVISVAAGIGLETMSDRVGRAVAIVRAMPNTPAAVGEGMIVCCLNSIAKTSGKGALAEALLSSIGRVAFVADETLMDAVTAVSGSGPAYVFHFIEALAAAGEASGLESDFALLLAKQTVYGAAKLAVEATDSPSKLREQVTSPNGTTAAALQVLMNDDASLRSMMKRAVDAAKLRSIELGA